MNMVNEYGEYSVEYPRGLRIVPFDAYTTKLHQGESVKTSKLESFKYYHVDDGPELVNTWNNGIVTSHAGEKYDWWNAEEAENFISKGIWIVVPKQKNIIDTIQIKIALEGLEEAKKAVGELAQASNTTLEAIKDFTANTGHDVYISNGMYKVYRKDEDTPYNCHTEEFLVQVMDAILTLDDAEKA